MKSLLPRLS